MTYLFNALGLIPMAAFMALLLGLSRGGNSAHRAEPDGEAGEDDFIYQVTPDTIRRGALPAKNLIDKD